MTLGEFFQMLEHNPAVLIFYFIAVPLSTFLACILSGDDKYRSPWIYLFSALIYLACVPGIFTVVLDLYLLIFERQSIMSINLYTQILPILSMLATIWILRREVDFDAIPGFSKLRGLMLMLFALFSVLWILEKMHFIVFSYVQFHWVLLLLVGLLVLVRYGWRKVFG